MAYIVVTKDRPPGTAQLCERVGPADFDADHFRNCLSERLAWAVEDAERQSPPPHDEERAVEVPERVLVNA